MTEGSRYLPISATPWDAAAARAAIAEIVDDALAHYDRGSFWPVHPMDGNSADDGDPTPYVGAAGVIWGLDYLGRIGASDAAIDFKPALPTLNDRMAEYFVPTRFGPYAEHGSLLLGDLGSMLVAMRLAPDQITADRIAVRVRDNFALPVRDLMWGLAGSMVACLHMHAITGETRWRELFATQAERLLADLEPSEHGELWTQDLYGGHQRWLGAVHGYAGNMIPLINGWAWLDTAQQARVENSCKQVLAGTALIADEGINWPGILPAEPGDNALCQYCHGAPGIVVTMASAPFSDSEFDRLLLEGGRLIWSAGPLAKGSNLCHGTGGNGYALLKLHRRTGDPVWLERARGFAMTGIEQCRSSRREAGRGRYSLWTGDIGLAIYLADCIREDARFPSIDVI